jgi:heat shock protein HspQ
MKKQDLPPEVEDLKNENEYLHLNILNLENEICQIHEHENKMKQERREHRHTPHRHSITEQEEEEDPENAYLMQSLLAIREQALKDMEQVEKERQEADALIE